MKKNLLSFIFFCWGIFFVNAQAINRNNRTYNTLGGWVLIFEDDFNYLNKDEWNTQDYQPSIDPVLNHLYSSSSHDDFCAENYASVCQESNISSVGSSLSLHCGREIPAISSFAECGSSTTLIDGFNNFRAFNYSGSVLKSRKRYKYGKFELRAKFTNKYGYSPGFWLYGLENGKYREIDVCEFDSDDNTKVPINLNFSLGNTSNNDDRFTSDKKWFNLGSGNWVSFDYSSYNTFTLYWEPWGISIYVNGLLAQDWDPNEICASHFWYTITNPHPKHYFRDYNDFDVPMNIVINNKTLHGYKWWTTHTHPDITDFSGNDFELDYLKVWQRLDCTYNSIVDTIFDYSDSYLGNNVDFVAPAYGVYANHCQSTNKSYPNSKNLDVFYVNDVNLGNGWETSSQIDGRELRLHKIACPAYSALREVKKDSIQMISEMINNWDKEGIKYTIIQSKIDPNVPEKMEKNKFLDVIELNIYPNPFVSSSKIVFKLPKDENNVQISIYNIMRQKVKEIETGKNLQMGTYTYSINREQLASGVYQLQLKTESGIINKQIVIQ